MQHLVARRQPACCTKQETANSGRQVRQNPLSAGSNNNFAGSKGHFAGDMAWGDSIAPFFPCFATSNPVSDQRGQICSNIRLKKSKTVEKGKNMTKHRQS